MTGAPNPEPRDATPGTTTAAAPGSVAAPGDASGTTAELRDGDVGFARHFARLFATEPEFMGEPIDDLIAIARYDHNGVASLVTLGLERVRLPGDARIELLCEVVEAQAPAAEVAVRIAVERVLGRLGTEPGPMVPGDVWINATPFLAGTRIQGLVAVGEEWSGREQTVRDESGAEVGCVNEIVMLTTNEAKRLAVDGAMPLLEAAATSPTARFDVLRDDLVTAPEPLPRLACVVTRAAVEHGVRWLQRDTDGRYLAINRSESAEYLADADNFETAPIAQLVAGVPELRGFVTRAEPGEYALFGDDGWTFGALADEGAPAPVTGQP